MDLVNNAMAQGTGTKICLMKILTYIQILSGKFWCLSPAFNRPSRNSELDKHCREFVGKPGPVFRVDDIAKVFENFIWG